MCFRKNSYLNFIEKIVARFSWEGHLAGAVVGFIFAVITRNHGPKRQIYSWENQSEPDAREKWLWEKYKESLPEEERKAIEEKYGEQRNEESEDGDYWYRNDTFK